MAKSLLRILLVFLLLSARPAATCDLSLWEWFNPFSSLPRRAAKVLPLPNSESIRSLKTILGATWFNDYLVTAEALRKDLGKTLSAEASRGPLSLAEARAVIQKALADQKGMNEIDHGELLLDAVLAASRGNGNVIEAFDWVVSAHRPNHAVAERPLEGKLFRVRWDKRHGDTRKGIEGIVRDQNGDFVAFELRAGRRELNPKSFPVPDGKYNFAIDREGKIYYATENSQWPHPTLIGGRDPMVYGAGEFLIVDGKLAWVNDGSGHYMPKGSLKNLESFFGALPKEAFHPRFRGYMDHLETFYLTAGKI